MNVSVFGFGYVGSVTAACLAAGEHRVPSVHLADLKLPLLEAILPSNRSGRNLNGKGVEVRIFDESCQSRG
jgi:hypothetical protein